MNANRLIGQRVTRRMKEMGYASDDALARDTGLTPKTIWRLRNGKSYPRDDTAQRISAALNMPLSELRPPQTPEDDPELRDQLGEVLRRLQRIEAAVGVSEDPRVDELEDLAGDAAPKPPQESGQTAAPPG